MSESFAIGSTVKNYPKGSYSNIKTVILGKTYRLQLNFVGSKRAVALNQTYRQKTYTPNVLSFPLDKNTGEIYICPTVAKREAKKFDLTYNGYVTFLFIHGCLHLKGFDHGATMDKLEQHYKRKFNVA
jgi:probable rRNA maturation factor